MNSKHLVVGTGPLFDFGKCFGNGLTRVVGCSVSLSSSSLTNTTSTRLPSTFPCSCSFVTQRLIGVSVSESTNHLCGTSGMRLDWSGSSLLSNCSFTSCTTNDDPPEPVPEPIPEQGQAIDDYTSQTTQLRLTQSESDENEYDPVWIMSCTFSDLSSGNGAALYVWNYRADVVVKDSSFNQCCATLSGSSGGAIDLGHSRDATSKKYSATLFNCRFSNNTAGSGGHLVVIGYESVTMAKCTFTDSRSPSDTPLDQKYPFYFTSNPNTRFDNCTISDNEGSQTGGIYFNSYLQTGSIILTDVLFKDNVCTARKTSGRVTDCVVIIDKEISTVEFFDCFSTSAQPHCGDSQASTVYPDLIGPSITSVNRTIQENENRDGFEVVLLFEGVFTGTSSQFDVTLKKTDGTVFVAEKVSFSKTAGKVTIALNNPNVPSLHSSASYSIVDVKKSASQSTSNELVFEGETEPDWTWWHHTPKSRAGNMIGLSFTTPKEPTLTEIKADLALPNMDDANVTVTVSSIFEGSYTLVVFDASDPLKTEIMIGPFSFSTSTTTAKSSQTAGIRPSGPLSYGKTYNLKSFSSQTQNISITPPSFWVRDEPSRISNVDATLSGKFKTELTLTLSGENILQGRIVSIGVKEMEGDAIKEGALLINVSTRTEGLGGPTTMVNMTSFQIYNKTRTLEYSKKYKIISLTVNAMAAAVTPTATITVPDSPGRVEEAEGVILNGEQPTASVSVKGVNFPLSLTSMKVKRGSIEISSTSIVRDSASELTVEFGAGKEETSKAVQFGERYEIVEISGDSEVIVNPGVGFTIPVPGTVESTLTELNSETNEHFKVIVIGKDFVPETEWTLKLTDREEEILVTMKSETMGESLWVKAGGLDEIAFDCSYSIVSMTNVTETSDIVLSSGISVHTPPASTLIGIKAEMNTTDSDEVIQSLTSERISAGSFTLVVNKAGDDQHTPISITPFAFSVSTAPIDSSLSLPVIPSSLLSCGETYAVHSLSSPSMIVSHSSLTFQVPCLLRAASASLNLSDFDEVIVKLTAFGFPSSTPITLTIVEVDEDNTQTGLPFTVTETPSTNEDSTHILTSRIETAKLQHGKSYEITQCDVTNRKTVLDGRILFRVPPRPTLTGVDFSFATTSNTTFHLIVEGTDLPVGVTFLVSLDGFDEAIEVRFSSPSGGSSAELALGWSDTLQFDTAYPLVSVLFNDSPTSAIPSTHLTLQPIPRPNPLIVFVSDSGASDPKLCGAVERPCSSVDVSMNLIDRVAARSATITLIKKAAINSPMTIKSGLEMALKQHLQPPTLVIPSTASLDKSTCLVSVAGTLTLKEVKIEVQIDVPSFVLFDVKGGELVMESVQISGVGSSSAVVDGIEGLSSWETGLIKLHESNCSLTSCVLSSIGMGEIWMESSNLSLMSTEIVHSGSRFSLFPSAQQDVMCESGNISIVPSSSDTSEDRWISSTSECSVTLNGSELKSPHFVAWIDVKKSNSTLSKKKDSFSVLIVGSKLIPCDLKLKVSESSSSSSSSQSSNLKSSSSPVVIALSFSSVELWNETHINVSIAMSSLSSLSMDSEWRARIVFGNGEYTDSFTFLESLKVRRAQSLRQSLPWLIPVIVCAVLLLLAVIVVVICRRRRKATNSDSSTIVNQPTLSENEAVENSIEVLKRKASDDNEDTRDELGADDGQRMDSSVVAMKCEGQFEMEMVDGKKTLFNRMHFGDGVGCEKRREIEKKIVRGLVKMVELENLESGIRLSPHWILLNENDSVFIRVESGIEKKDEHDKPSLPNNTQSSESHTGMKDEIDEIRYRAPEQGEKEGELKEGVDGSKVIVFRVGLVLWEIETGVVPFGEVDGVEAHSKLSAGIGVPLETVSDTSMRELIEGCLQIDADQRMTLDQVLARLQGIPEESEKNE
ncbi:hypothetical protein BLNAU_2055 [Blattamonas nauphoetae]|uniref:Protein kinase domain-containing protein n=1 Tax=Blattamonas nauphoetae TaxID=2049346 RepID=A0ABQ9YH06_9EUKA|nr:hypothetical protein BLNAU_2055 [Blattamonas nauphoetae]